MAEAADVKASKPVHPCPICKENGANAFLLKAGHQIAHPLVPDLAKCVVLPTKIDVHVFVVDQYICRTCGITYNKMIDEKVIQAPAQYQDQHGHAVDFTKAPRV